MLEFMAKFPERKRSAVTDPLRSQGTGGDRRTATSPKVSDPRPVFGRQTPKHVSGSEVLT